MAGSSKDSTGEQQAELSTVASATTGVGTMNPSGSAVGSAFMFQVFGALSPLRPALSVSKPFGANDASEQTWRFEYQNFPWALASSPREAVVFSTSATTEVRPGYTAVQGALTAMHRVAGGGQWSIEGPVYNASVQVLEILKENDVPAPKVISHGPSSVVLSWENADRNLYLTVTEHSVGMLCSTRNEILLRQRLPQPSIEPSRSVFAALKFTPKLGSE
jgi:hypothetical protein